MEKTKISLDSNNLLKLVLRLSVSSILSNFILAIYYIINMKFISMINSEALAMLAITYPINTVIYSITIGTGVGTASLLSKLLGEKKYEEASNVAGNILIFTFIYGLIALLVGAFFSKQIIALFGSQNPLINSYSISYIRITLIGAVAIFVPMVSFDILKGQGRTVAPLLTLFSGTILNIVLDILFIFGFWKFPALGVKGAAWAAVIAKFVSGAFCVALLFNKKNVIVPNLRAFHYMKESLKQLYKLSMPTIFAAILVSTVTLSINSILKQCYPSAITLTGILVTLSDALIFLPTYGLAQGYLPVASYNYGAKNYDKLRKVIKYGLTLTAIISLLGSSLFIFFPHFLLKRFITSDPGLLKSGILAFRIVGVSYLLSGLNIMAAATFQSIGKSAQIAILAALRSIIILIPAAYILAKVGGFNFVWLAYIISEGISFIVIFTWLYRTLKKFKNTDNS